MKKTNTEKIDRNTSISKYFTSSSLYYPRTAVKAQTGVEIIEIHSSNTSESNDDTLNLDHRHAWSYVDKIQPYTNENNYTINSSARERRRLKNKVCPEAVSKHLDYLLDENRKYSHSEHLNPNYNSTWNNVERENVLPFNRFPFLNNEFLDSDQSLSDSESGLEIIQCGDVILEDDLCVNKDTSEGNTNNDKDIDNNVKRTIWIYSFKNKNLLSEDFKQPTNVFTEDSTSSSSTENFENITEVRDRIASPIPASYIPKLDLYVAATLPTVREVSEPYQLPLENDETCTVKNGPHNSLTPINNWFENKNHISKDESSTKIEINSYSNHKTIPSHSVINWMSLSPREHKRNENLPNLIKSYDSENVELNKSIPKQTEVNDDLNVDGDITYIKTRSNDVIDEVILTKNINEQMQLDSIDEKGDYNKSYQLKKPQIHLKKVSLDQTNTNSIEKVNEDGWIGHNNERMDEINFEIDKDLGDDVVRREEITKCAGDRLFNKNMSLLKPVEWSQYLPITESIPSLHLSIPSDINEEKGSWFKYFIKYFICCKMCK